MPEYVYIATNENMPGLLKIGYSETPTDRLISLHTTGVPTPFELVALFPVARGRTCEAAIHNALSHYRVKSRREFFSVSLPSAIEIILPLLSAYLPHAQPGSPNDMVDEPGAKLDADAHHIIHWLFTGKNHTRNRNDIQAIFRGDYRDAVDQAIDRLLEQGLIAKLPRPSGSQRFVLTTKGLKYVYRFPEDEEG